MLAKAKSAYSLWLMMLNDFPRIHRHTLGNKIEQYFMEFLESIFTALYSPTGQKIERLAIAITKLDGVKFFLQLAWENRCIPQNKYIDLSEQLNEVGRMTGGWKKGLEKKTPAK